MNCKERQITNSKYYEKNREKVLAYAKERYQKKKEELKKKSRERYYKIKDYVKLYHQSIIVKARRKRYMKKYQKENIKKLMDYNLVYNRNRRHNDISFRILHNLRSSFSHLMIKHRGVKSDRMIKLVGCTKEELIQHLESQFKKGISWENYGEWHIDHIKPCCSFDLTKEEQQRECFHYSNLQPLWAEENLKKGGKVM